MRQSYNKSNVIAILKKYNQRRENHHAYTNFLMEKY